MPDRSADQLEGELPGGDDLAYLESKGCSCQLASASEAEGEGFEPLRRLIDA